MRICVGGVLPLLVVATFGVTIAACSVDVGSEGVAGRTEALKGGDQDRGVELRDPLEYVGS